MSAENFIYDNTVKKLVADYPKIKSTLIAQAASKALQKFTQGSDFKGKAFDVCYKVAEEHLKSLIKAKL